MADDEWTFDSTSGDETLGSALASGADEVAAPQGIGARLGDSIGALVVGLILIPLACAGLFWNEGHAVKVARALDEVGRLVHSVPADRLDPAYNDKLIQVSGPTASAKGVADDALGVKAKGLKLSRNVEMYQWHEKESGSGQDRKFTYSREWSSSAVSSGSFHAPSGHQNPAFTLKSRDFGAADAMVGAVPVGAKAVLLLGGAEDTPVDEAGVATAKKALGRPVQASGGGYYAGESPDSPRVGDMRITYKIVPEGPASFIGRQEPGGLEAYRASNGQEILLGYTGTHSADAVVQMGQDDNRLFTWIIRAVALLFLLVGFVMLFAPVNILASYVPILGSLVGGATFLVALVATLVVGPTVMAIAWFVYRPLLAGGIIAGAVVLALAFRQLRLRRRSPARLAPA
ncbi:TMEM43 family protein [Methylobacterium haplocladii]|uniref:Uncharacterized protein n=1 Tax=Methylobacterium haplocladii TaxID=1176176 RepID=A0A512ILF0_9HYPH|nr:TMEM43 family protein [Methylobacterium haplocladii]GEO98524.1 hypothetical protein MHA02_09120 [Methylobacterium haplocladii]GJD82829.1 hypothetical protein HPGCJGGD_0690 [Methylobacterium haplocladii]GLS60553.1 hypothetical protein GCM10007887_32320 [Methylobacterium haplocladii]